MFFCTQIVDVTDGIQDMMVRPSKWTLGMPITCIRYMPTNLYWALGCTPHGDIFCFSPEEEGFETLIKGLSSGSADQKLPDKSLKLSADGTQFFNLLTCACGELLHGQLTHRGPQSRHHCIYWLCSSSQACSV